MNARPPRVAEWLLARSLPPGGVGRSILGDLHEEYRRFRPRPLRDLWYTAVALRIAAGYLAGSWSFSLVRELRHALRLMLRRRGFAVMIVATLALGIGATTAIFSVVDAVLLRPLPYERPEELFNVWDTYPYWRGHDVLDSMWDTIALDYPEYERWRDNQRSFAAVAIHAPALMALTGHGEPAELLVGRASSTLFPLLGVGPARGRGFTAAEEGPAASRVALLSHELWQGRLGGVDPVIGSEVLLDGTAFEVIGVLPAGFHFRSMALPPDTPPADVWIPVGSDGADLNDGDHHYEAIARLAAGVTAEQAFAETEPLLRGERSPEARGIRITPRAEEEHGATREPLLLLQVAVGLLLLVGCANVATVMLGEVTRRRQEFATRAALGAGRFRLARQILTECALLGAIGAGVGLFVARAGVALLLRFAPPGLPLPAEVGIDARVLIFSSVLGIGTGLLFGWIPAFAILRADLEPALRRGAQAVRATGGRLQQSLVVVEVALALVLLVSAGLLGRSLAAVFAVNPGFVAKDLNVSRIMLPESRYDDAATLRFAREALAELRAQPGVAAVSGSSRVPFITAGSSSFEIEGREVPPDADHPEAFRQNVMPGFHEIMGIPLIAGRTFSELDGPEAPPVVVISEAMAQRYWPDGSALGSRILRDDRSWEIVGIVGDVLHRQLTGERKATFYVPFLQQPARSLTLVVKTGRGLEAVAPMLRRAVWQVDPALPVDEVGTFASVVARSAAEERYRAFLLGAFGLAAAALTGVGIFGVTARAVVGRTRELGIRIALGARNESIVRLVIGSEVAALALGVVLGIGGALLAGRLLGHFLFGVKSSDPLTYVAATAFLVLLGLVASYLPARPGSTRPTFYAPNKANRREWGRGCPCSYSYDRGISAELPLEANRRISLTPYDMGLF